MKALLIFRKICSGCDNDQFCSELATPVEIFSFLIWSPSLRKELFLVSQLEKIAVLRVPAGENIWGKKKKTRFFSCRTTQLSESYVLTIIYFPAGKKSNLKYMYPRNKSSHMEFSMGRKRTPIFNFENTSHLLLLYETASLYLWFNCLLTYCKWLINGRLWKNAL